MRVISGTLKGRTIKFIKGSHTRPLKDSVKESIFNVMRHSNFFMPNIEESSILDLYSGIGSFGIECISRGAMDVTFVEKNILVAKVLKENLSNLSITKKSKIYVDGIENFLKSSLKKKFDIFFLDPPFAENGFLKILELIKKKKIFRKDHIVIIHRENKTNDNFKDIFNIINVKQYGRSKILFGILSK